MRRQLLIAVVLLGAPGCPTRDKYDPIPTVRITSPAVGTTYTNGTVRITAAIDPVLELPIVLLDNGAELTTLSPPTYSFDWLTSTVPEGTHSIVAAVAFSSGDVRSQPVTVVVDRTPPTVTGRTPAPGATGVMLRSPIQVAFSETVVLSQPADATFSLSNTRTSTVGGHVTFDVQRQTATIAIDDLGSLPLPATLTGTIDASITDLAGNALISPSDDWAWQVPDNVKLPQMPPCSNLPPLERLPVFAVGADLNPVVEWAASVAVAGVSRCQLQVSKYGGGQWNALATPSSEPGSAVQGAALALDAGGHPVVAWRPPSAPAPGEIDLASSTGAGWTSLPPIVPQSGVSFPVVYPLLRVDPAGQPVLLWGAGTQADRYFLARLAGTTWSGDFGTIPIGNNAPFDGPHFDMILAADGNPIVSYVVSSATGHVSRWNGTSWSSAPDVLGMSEPFMALDSTQDPIVVSSAPGLFYVQHLVDGAWQPMTPVAVPPQARHPHVGTGPDGLPVVIWFDGQTTSVGLARWTAQQRWDTRAVFAFGPDARDEPPQLVVDRQGTAWIGWRDSAGAFDLWMTNF